MLYIDVIQISTLTHGERPGELKFVLRKNAKYYQVPKNLLRLLDLALEAANICLEPSNQTD